MEYLQVFNNKREMLNEKVPRKEKFNLKDGKYFMIILLFIENSNGEFLIQKTSKEKRSVNATTGGHVSYGDDGLKTVIKESKEELGLKLDVNELEFVDSIYENNCIIEIYYVKRDIDINGLVIQKEEVEYVKWYSVDKIMELIDNNDFRETNIEPFKLVLKNKKD